MVQLEAGNLLGIRNRETDVLYIYQDGEQIWPGKAVRVDTGFLKYYPGNVKQSFMGDKGNPNAPRDQELKTLVYKSTNFSSMFQGPDDARVALFTPTYDEFMNYKSSNIATYFNAYVDVGTYDQELKYDEFNFVDMFTRPTLSEPTAVYDFWHHYKGTEFGLNFLGPDEARNYIEPPAKDEFYNYDETNIATYFNAYVDVGTYDQELKYDKLNISSLFTAPSDALETSVYDFWHHYKGTEFGTSFLGPDEARNPILAPPYEEFYNYDETNISSQFIYFVDTGTYDQEVKYNYSNIITTFTGTVQGSDTAISDFTLLYKSTNFSTLFLGPDSGDATDYTPTYLEWLNYDETTIANEFKNPPDPGVKDFDLVYSYSIIPIYFLP